MVWNLFPLKVVLVWGKARSHRVQNLGCRDTEWPGWFDVLPKSSAGERVHCRDEAANHQLSIAASYRIIRIVSAEECSSLTWSLMQIPCFTCSVILNATTTQYTCSLNSIYRPHWLVQWNCHCSTCAFQSTLLGCQVTPMLCKPFLLY